MKHYLFKGKNLLTIWYIIHILIHITFEWDKNKNLENIEKHNVSFETAQEAFFDKKRINISNQKHSKGEERFFCIDNDGNGILSVRFTMRSNNIRIIGAGYWREGRIKYEEKIIYIEAPKNISSAIAKGKGISDFLPPPDKLVRK